MNKRPKTIQRTPEKWMSLDTEYVANRNGCHWTKDAWQTEGLIPEAFRNQPLLAVAWRHTMF